MNSGLDQGVEKQIKSSRAVLAAQQQDCVCEHLSFLCSLLSFLVSSLQLPFQSDDPDLEAAIASARPQLVEFLSHRPGWLLTTCQCFLPGVALNGLDGITYHREKVSVLLELLGKAGPATWKQFAQYLCMECDLPLDLEILLMSSAGGGNGDGASFLCLSPNTASALATHNQQIGLDSETTNAPACTVSASSVRGGNPLWCPGSYNPF